VIVLPVTYTPITSQTLSSATSSITFSSISGSYTDLVLVASPLRDATTGGYVTMQFNSDTGSNYSNTGLLGNGTTTQSSRTSSQTIAYLNWGADGLSTTNPNTMIASFQNYSNTTTYKTYLSRANQAGSAVDAVVGLWRSTSAISTIAISRSTGSFAIGSTFTLYGIKAA
jgi:hypothetical protein